MKTIVEKFKCDNPECNKSAFAGKKYSYPYEKGWVYLYNIAVKFQHGEYAGAVGPTLRDKQFCSLKCLQKTICSWLNEEHKKYKEGKHGRSCKNV